MAKLIFKTAAALIMGLASACGDPPPEPKRSSSRSEGLAPQVLVVRSADGWLGEVIPDSREPAREVRVEDAEGRVLGRGAPAGRSFAFRLTKAFKGTLRCQVTYESGATGTFVTEL